MSNTIRICPEHLERPTPLLWTFAFPHKEYWCPHCGYTSGMLGAGVRTRNSPELAATLAADKAASAEYLRQLITPEQEWEIENYSDIDRCAKQYIALLLRNINRTSNIRPMIAQFVAWKWLLGHPDADTFPGAHDSQR